MAWQGLLIGLAAGVFGALASPNDTLRWVFAVLMVGTGARYVIGRRPRPA